MLEVEKKRLREQFKDWFKPDAQKIRKKNYIGDQIVVEKMEQEDEVSENEEEKDVQEQAEG